MKKFIYCAIALIVLGLAIYDLMLIVEADVEWDAPKVTTLLLTVIMAVVSSLGLLRVIVRGQTITISIKGDETVEEEPLWRKIEL